MKRRSPSSPATRASVILKPRGPPTLTRPFSGSTAASSDSRPVPVRTCEFQVLVLRLLAQIQLDHGGPCLLVTAHHLSELRSAELCSRYDDATTVVGAALHSAFTTAGTRESRVRLFTEILARCRASFQPKAVANTRSCR